MFESKVYTPEELRSLGDAALIDAITASARAAAAAEAHHLAAIAELTCRRLGPEQHPGWGCDDWDATAAEIGCALTLKHGRAMGLMDQALALAEAVPRVGALFLSGQISAQTARTVVSRTALVNDPHVRGRIDADIAEAITGWGPLSQHKLEAAIDAIIDRTDPEAVRRARDRVRHREIIIGDPRNDGDGLTYLQGRLSTTDAALLDATLTAMAKGVCGDDPRTLAQRRADALGALAAHLDHLVCACDNPDCTAKTGQHRAGKVLIHVVTNATINTAATKTGDAGKKTINTEQPTVTGPATDDAHSAEQPRRRPAAVIPGRAGGFLSAEAVTELITHGAQVRTVTTPAPDTAPQRRYRPSTALDEFIRTRDLTCRFPGCDHPAVRADIDHTHPYGDGGHTHPSSLSARCRLHHLLKTFWHGWTETQHPDGTLTITTPTGHSYTTSPLSTILFPDWNTNTGTTPPPRHTRRTRNHGAAVMMPARKQSRTKTRARYIARERALNAETIAAHRAARIAAAEAAGQPPPPEDHGPPPF